MCLSSKCNFMKGTAFVLFFFFKENSVVSHKRASPLVVNSAHETTETSVTFAYVIGRLVAESMLKVMKDWKLCGWAGG